MKDHTEGRRLLVAALLAAAIPLSPLAAQDRNLDREAPQGKVFRGTVGEDGGPAGFRLTLQGGQAIELVAAQVGGSDPYLRVFDANTGELLAENDDSAGSLSASARLYSAERRPLRIEVTSAAVEGDPGPMRFDLILRPSDFRPRPPLAIELGQTLSGTLDSEDEQVFRFRAERGQALTIAMDQAEGSSLDPMLEVFMGDDAVGEPLASDDDGGGGLNARLRFSVPRTGVYAVRARGVSPSAGAFTISAAIAAEIDTTPLEIDLGAVATGTLGGDVPERFYRLSESARAALASGSGSLVIEMRHVGEGEEALDPLLDAGFQTPLGFSSLVSDDDSGGGTNARVMLDVSGLEPHWLESLRIKAGAFEGSLGDYELTVTQGGEE
jgi:hypothetical protein